MTRTSTLLDGQVSIACDGCECTRLWTYISLPLALLRLRWWVLGPFSWLEGLLGIVEDGYDTAEMLYEM
jgi:hypothetical protein